MADAWSALRDHPTRFLAILMALALALAYLVTSVLVGIPTLLVLLYTLLISELAVVWFGVVVVRARSVLTACSAFSSGGGWRWCRPTRAPPTRCASACTPAGRCRLVARGRLRVPARGRALPTGPPVAGVPGLAAGRPPARTGAVDGDDDGVRVGRRSGAEAWLRSCSAGPRAGGAAYLLPSRPPRQAALARLLLDPRGGPLRPSSDLRRSRVDLVDAFETERRRIERDLHDGVQHRGAHLRLGRRSST